MAKQGGKSKRQQKPAKQLKRAACRAKAKVDAKERREAQAKRAAANIALRAAGLLTPWQESKSLRARRPLVGKEYELGA